MQISDEAGTGGSWSEAAAARIEPSHHMVLERLSLEHSQQLSVINEELQRLREEHRLLQEEYADLQVSSALQVRS